MGVSVDEIAQPFQAALERVASVSPAPSTVAAPPAGGVYLVAPGSYGAFRMVAALQKANVPVSRAAASFESAGRSFAPGTFVIPASAASRSALALAARETGVAVVAAPRAPAVAGFRMKAGTRVGLFKGANNMPSGWLMWMLEQYGINHQVMQASDFAADLAARYDVVLLPSGISRAAIVDGLSMERNDPAKWAWAAGVGDAGWKRLAEFVRGGGTLLAIGSAVETARQLFELPIENVLPRRPAGSGRSAGAGAGAGSPDRALQDAFTSPARLMQVLRDRVADPDSLFYCPGSLLQNEFDTSHPVGWGMPAAWPIFFESDAAYRLRPSFEIRAEVVSRYPREGILQSGWLLGEEYLRDQANIIAFRVGSGYVATFGSQVDFRTQPRATFTPLFNAMFHGPSTAVTAEEMAGVGRQN
jgi:hypothetical protein